MAFKEIHMIFHSDIPEKSKDLNVEIGGPFEWYMDGVMRGRFKEYSGEEVKGINIVNLICYSPEYARIVKANSGHGIRSEWVNLLNTYHYELELDLSVFNENQEQNIIKAIKIFIEHASLLNVPAMNVLVQHTKESLGKNSIPKAIANAAKEMEKAWQYISKKI